MKKILFIFLLSFSFCTKVNADYDCSYEGKTNEKISQDIHIKFTVKKDTIEIEQKVLDINETVILDTMVESDRTEKKIVEELGGFCPQSVYGCLARHTSAYSTDRKYGVLINNTLYSKIKFPFKFEKTPAGGYRFEIKKEECIEVEIDKKNSTGPVKDIVFRCDYVEDSYIELEKTICKHEDSTEDCIVDKSLYNRKKNILTDFCNTSLKYLSVNNDCVDACLKIKDRIYKLENNGNVGSKCGFSGKLLIFIANIVKWVKYIIPVVAIILGILDFIKAIATDKDDEMKKAQGKFVKRLIAAALIFIIPFVIEFILEKMGFAANGCGIIDL